ncbi:uncharacterized protein BDR25DRAFT_312054 [Lindgomyces ingoldianus]|uniref:Uncharacterized protein n=1 Tax=Lindgomyces ingoldianus TaxID=673940 RepID=A0ACB6R6E3_9PLEO|nr:uncharacterized protein BDR25DRAFT_312054 [Lindgomyces ingoldianus]KAF2473885.1 hypothetical protein BDR25DRAFT_312054 [Lindgomyces ingoldianus]
MPVTATGLFSIDIHPPAPTFIPHALGHSKYTKFLLTASRLNMCNYLTWKPPCGKAEHVLRMSWKCPDALASRPCPAPVYAIYDIDHCSYCPTGPRWCQQKAIHDDEGHGSLSLDYEPVFYLLRPDMYQYPFSEHNHGNFAPAQQSPITPLSPAHRNSWSIEIPRNPYMSTYWVRPGAPQHSSPPYDLQVGFNPPPGMYNHHYHHHRSPRAAPPTPSIDSANPGAPFELLPSHQNLSVLGYELSYGYLFRRSRPQRLSDNDLALVSDPDMNSDPRWGTLESITSTDVSQSLFAEPKSQIKSGSTTSLSLPPRDRMPCLRGGATNSGYADSGYSSDSRLRSDGGKPWHEPNPRHEPKPKHKSKPRHKFKTKSEDSNKQEPSKITAVSGQHVPIPSPLRPNVSDIPHLLDLKVWHDFQQHWQWLEHGPKTSPTRKRRNTENSSFKLPSWLRAMRILHTAAQYDRLNPLFLQEMQTLGRAALETWISWVCDSKFSKETIPHSMVQVHVRNW